MADKYVRLTAGELVEIEASALGGTGHENEIPALDGSGLLDVSMMPTGIAPEVVTCKAHEAVAAGELVNLFLDSGELKAQLACAATGLRADGYVLTAQPTPGSNCTVFLEGTITATTLTTVGARLWLSDTPGATTETAPSDSGHIVQTIGKVLANGAGTSTCTFEPSNPITLA